MGARPIDVVELLTRVQEAATAWDDQSVVTDLHEMQGGNSSFTYGATVRGAAGDTRIVLKVAPPGVPPVKNRDVLRQARLLRALEGSPGVRVPQILFESAGDPPEVPPFFAMRFVDGDSFEPILDETDVIPAPEEITARELHCAQTLAALHRVRPSDIGLADEPISTLEGEVERWVKVLATVDPELRPRADEGAAALLAHLPDPTPPVILHGDFRLGNTLARDGEVRAIIDWEIWAEGDARVDLGWFLMFTHPSKQPTAIREAAGMPSEEELLATYEAARSVPIADMEWFHALSRFKAGAITAQIIKHNARRETPDPIAAGWAPHVPVGFVDQALAMLQSS
jgi:aminoglycoside phosphotransferase (APT) family kinase protein